MDKVRIDGVDVSGCNMKCDNGDCALYYAELNNDNNELIYGFNCSDNQYCYYKQLKRLQAENERLKEEKGGMQILIDNYIALTEKYRQALQEIRGIAEKMYNTNDEDVERDFYIKLQDKINEVMGEE